MPLTRRRLLAACAVSALGRRLLAQTPSFSSDVKVVNLFASVHDAHGRLVNDLLRTDFTLAEDGRRQTIRYFSRETELPLTVGLMIDTSSSTRSVQPAERAAGSRFLRRVMRPDQDRAFVTQFDSRILLVQELTHYVDDLDQAASTVGNLATYHTGRELNPPGAPDQPRGGTLLFDAVLCVANEIMQQQSGRRAVVILSDGMDAGSVVTLAGAIEAAQRADMLIYSILFGGFSNRTLTRAPRSPYPNPYPIGLPPIPLPRPAPKLRPIVLPWQGLSTATGGRHFEISGSLTLDDVFDQIEDDLRHQYSIGYTSDRPALDSTYRRIALTTRRTNLTVRTREGYYAS